jgi:hypothetical protein
MTTDYNEKLRLSHINNPKNIGNTKLLNSVVLPLKLGSFSAVRKTGQVELIWETLSEENTSHFEIERSPDGINWSRIGEVAAMGPRTEDQKEKIRNKIKGTKIKRTKIIQYDDNMNYIKEWNSLREIERFDSTLNRSKVSKSCKTGE